MGDPAVTGNREVVKLAPGPVLYRPVGDAKVTHDQLMRLVEMSQRPTITVQVVPYSAGAHSGLQGAFMLAEFDDTPGIVHMETAYHPG